MAKPFCAKWFEEFILHSVGEKAARDKNARAYLKKLAKHAATAYRIGKREAIEGKALATSYQPEDATELLQAANRLCYNVYRTGYEQGEKERGETG